MKILVAILALVGTACTLRAQDAGYAFVTRPRITRRDLAASRFWTKSTIALVTLDGAAKAADSLATRRNMDGGGEEYNPLARPFVHTPLVQVGSMAALFAAEIAIAYRLHRNRRDKMARALLISGAAANSLGAAISFQCRVANW